MEHSKSYDVKAPAGPAGENLFQGTGTYNAMDAVSSWYEEIKACGTFPGCHKGNSGTVGHFTALIWHGDKQIGCLGNSYSWANYTPVIGGFEGLCNITQGFSFTAQETCACFSSIGLMDNDRPCYRLQNRN